MNCEINETMEEDDIVKMIKFQRIDWYTDIDVRTEDLIWSEITNRQKSISTKEKKR